MELLTAKQAREIAEYPINCTEDEFQEIFEIALMKTLQNKYDTKFKFDIFNFIIGVFVGMSISTLLIILLNRIL